MERKADEYALWGQKKAIISDDHVILRSAIAQLKEWRKIQKGLPKSKYREKLDKDIHKLHCKIAELQNQLKIPMENKPKQLEKKLKETKYKVILFKTKGHETWRMTMATSLPPNIEMTEQKIIEIDRITGEVIVK